MKRRAFVITIVGLALLFIAATIKSGWLYLVASVLFSLVVLGLVFGWLATRGLEITRECPGDAFEDEPFPVKLRVRNTGAFARNFLVVSDMAFESGKLSSLLEKVRRHRAEYREFMSSGMMPEEAGGPAAGSGPYFRTVAFERIAPRGKACAEYELSAPRRGIYSSADLQLSSGGPFGTAQFSRKVRVRSPIVVYPRISLLQRFPFQTRSMAAQVEALDWSRKGVGQDYYGVREYVRGDSLRDIHWRSSARQGELIVKEHQQEFRPSAGLVVVLQEPLFGDEDSNSLEDGLRCAASILNYYAAMGGMPRLVLPTGKEPEVIAGSSLYDGLEVLAGYRAISGAGVGGGRSPLSRMLELARSALPPGSALTVVTNADPDSIAAGLEVAPDLDGSSLVVVIDGSYGRDWDTGTALLEVGQLKEATAQTVNLFVMTRGREIGECLSVPLSTTAT